MGLLITQVLQFPRSQLLDAQYVPATRVKEDLLFWQFVPPLHPFGSTYMTSIFLLSYYLLATNFPVTGDIAEPLDKGLDHVTMSSPFGQVAKTVDGWRWMNTYLNLNILNWVLAPPFPFSKVGLYIMRVFFSHGVFFKKHKIITLAALIDFLSRLRECDFNNLTGFNFIQLEHVFLESRMSGAEGTIKSHEGCYP